MVSSSKNQPQSKKRVEVRGLKNELLERRTWGFDANQEQKNHQICQLQQEGHNFVFYFERIGIVIEKQCDALFKSYPTPFSNQKMVAGSLSTGDEQRLPALVKNPGYD